MSAELRILTGARAGGTVPINREIVVGRQSRAGLRFDPDQDLEVSGLHATILFDQGRWVLRDLGSRNGTFLNGRRVHEADLRDGDTITFGWKGPEVEFRAGPDDGADIDGRSISRTRDIPREGLTQIVRSNRQLRMTSVALGAALVGVAAFAVWSTVIQRSGWERDRAQLLERIDSVLAAGQVAEQTLAGEREGLAEALRESQAEVLRVRAALERAGEEDTAGVEDLRRQFQAALTALDRQRLAAALDYRSIEAMTRRAVAVIWVEASDGAVSTGTAFAVRPDATLVTSRHILVDEASPGDRPRRIGIQFSDSDQVFPARILQIADDADVAIIRADNIIGDVPVVAGLNLRPDTIPVGAAVAWLGFPLGGQTWPQDQTTGSVARPLGSVGVITNRTNGAIELQGYGAPGASGSPILDRDGAVIAVLIGGSDQDRAARLVGVPATAIADLLERVPSAGGPNGR